MRCLSAPKRFVQVIFGLVLGPPRNLPYSSYSFVPAEYETLKTADRQHSVLSLTDTETAELFLGEVGARRPPRAVNEISRTHSVDWTANVRDIVGFVWPIAFSIAITECNWQLEKAPGTMSKFDHSHESVVDDTSTGSWFKKINIYIM